MSGRSDHRTRLASLLGEVAVQEGVHRTSVEGVEVVRVSEPVPRAPIVYQPKILVVGQGLYFPQLSHARIRGFPLEFEGSASFCVPARPPAKGINAQHPRISRRF